MKELWTTFIHDKMLIIASVVAFFVDAHRAARRDVSVVL